MGKYFISFDLEGISGISNREFSQPNGQHYELSKHYIHHDINAVIEGILSGDQEAEIVVKDGHGNAGNLDLKHLHPKAGLLSGWKILFDMISPLDSTYKGVYLVGYHACGTNINSTLAHTFTDSICQIKINGQRFNEAGINALLAGLHNVPVVFFSGDSEACRETKEILKFTEYVSVKESLGRNTVLSLPLKESKELLFQGAGRATERLKTDTYPPLRIDDKIDCEIAIYEKAIDPSIFVRLKALLGFDELYKFDEDHLNIKFSVPDVQNFADRFFLIANLFYYVSHHMP